MTDPYTYEMDYQRAYRKAFARPYTTIMEADRIAHEEAGRLASRRHLEEEARTRRDDRND